jgi:hypothetical protein
VGWGSSSLTRRPLTRRTGYMHRASRAGLRVTSPAPEWLEFLADKGIEILHSSPRKKPPTGCPLKDNPRTEPLPGNDNEFNIGHLTLDI